MRVKHSPIWTKIRITVNHVFPIRNQRLHCKVQIFDFDNECIEENVLEASKLVHRRKINKFDLIGWIGAKQDVNLIQYYPIPLLVNKQEIESVRIKKANQFIPFNFWDIQMLNKLTILRGATSLDFFLKGDEAIETKQVFLLKCLVI